MSEVSRDFSNNSVNTCHYRIGIHCEKGVKLAIKVLAAEFGDPAPSPFSLSGPAPSSASWISPDSKFVAMVVSAFAMFVVIMT
ncbi:hypothetical protein CQW23_28177 [Capsicum baccatum]|uniref:Uncharacterized protein n=1 Tax=Capsicum baccatum TaxID=33114 RepID=A0A2G2VFS2_CAPBA|nr:hypothetical protein CQW23_28177 [Capsicum baccatum]